jgi:hypothetical protein
MTPDQTKILSWQITICSWSNPNSKKAQIAREWLEPFPSSPEQSGKPIPDLNLWMLSGLGWKYIGNDLYALKGDESGSLLKKYLFWLDILHN